MKLVRYGRAGAEKPGLIDGEGVLRDLSRVVKDITPDVLSPAGLKRLRAVKTERLPVVRGRPRLGCRSRTSARSSASGSTTRTTRRRSPAAAGGTGGVHQGQQRDQRPERSDHPP